MVEIKFVFLKMIANQNGLLFDLLLIIGAPGGTRTPNPRVRSPILYPVELQARFELPEVIYEFYLF